MIEVTIRKNEIKIYGHAGCAEKGKDIVCAAVSILEHTLLRSLKILTEDNVNIEREKGFTVIQFKDLSKEGKLLVDSFFIGISDIAVKYPECVKMR